MGENKNKDTMLSVMAESDATGLRIEALNFALRYAPDGNADHVVSDATTYLAFLQGGSQSS